MTPVILTGKNQALLQRIALLEAEIFQLRQELDKPESTASHNILRGRLTGRTRTPAVIDCDRPAFSRDIAAPIPRQVRGRLPTEERQRRRESGLCFYCGAVTHTVHACPKLQSKLIFRHRRRGRVPRQSPEIAVIGCVSAPGDPAVPRPAEENASTDREAVIMDAITAVEDAVIISVENVRTLEDPVNATMIRPTEVAIAPVTPCSFPVIVTETKPADDKSVTQPCLTEPYIAGISEVVGIMSKKWLAIKVKPIDLSTKSRRAPLPPNFPRTQIATLPMKYGTPMFMYD